MINDFEEFRNGHLVRTAEVWKRLCELGANEETKLDFDFTFTAFDKRSANALKDVLKDYPITISKEGILKPKYTISGNSGAIEWTEEQLLKWVDYLLSVGSDVGCEFDGCGANAPK